MGCLKGGGGGLLCLKNCGLQYFDGVFDFEQHPLRSVCDAVDYFSNIKSLLQ